jgi:hypothetical protein
MDEKITIIACWHRTPAVLTAATGPIELAGPPGLRVLNLEAGGKLLGVSPIRTIPNGGQTALTNSAPHFMLSLQHKDLDGFS